MKKYQAPQIEVTVFEVEDVVTTLFNSVNLGEWDKNSNYGKPSGQYFEA